MLTAHVT